MGLLRQNLLVQYSVLSIVIMATVAVVLSIVKDEVSRRRVHRPRSESSALRGC